MEILEINKGETLDGFDRYYFNIKSMGGNYLTSITFTNKKLLGTHCTCMFWTYEISRKIKTNKQCRHIKLALDYLKKENLLK